MFVWHKIYAGIYASKSNYLFYMNSVRRGNSFVWVFIPNYITYVSWTRRLKQRGNKRYTLFKKLAKRDEIKLNSLFLKSFQYQIFYFPSDRLFRWRSHVIFRCQCFSLFYTDLLFPPLPGIGIRHSCRSQCFFSQWKGFDFLKHISYIYCPKPFIPNETLTSIPIKIRMYTLTHMYMYIPRKLFQIFFLDVISFSLYL